MANLSGNVNLIAGGVQYALFIIFSSIMFFFVDKIGRRTLLIYGALSMAFCHFVVGGVLGSYGVNVPEGVNGDANILIRVTGAPAHTVIAFSYLLIIIYALTLAPICWIYAAEVWSLETRATGMGIAAIGNWLVRHHFFSPPSQSTNNHTVQLRHRPLHPARLPQHQIRPLPHLRRLLRARRPAVLAHLPRDVRQDD